MLGILVAWASCPARDVGITILHTADIHGHMAGRPGAGGGLLRCAALVKEIREREKNVLLLDCGDFIQGSAESFSGRGEIMMLAAHAMRYDALIPGNHEFDWGVDNLRRLYGMIDIPVLVANAFSVEGREPVLPNAEPFIVREIEGVRVAIIGLITPHMPRWFRPRLLGDVRFMDSVPALRRVMPRVRASGPDIIILAAHQGHRQWGGDTPANQINAVARAFPDIDVIIGGHTHEEVVMRDVHGVPYTQAGCHGLWLGKISLVVDPEKRAIRSMTFDLLPADETVRPEAAMEEKFAGALAETEAYLEEIVGMAASPLSGNPDFPGQSGTQMLIADAIAEAVGADVVIHQSLSEHSLSPGPIRIRDVWGIVPYENYIGVAHLTLPDIVAILEENSGHLGTRHFRGVLGLVYEIHSGYPEGLRIRNVVLADGRRMADGERVRVAMNSYDMASGGGRLRVLRSVIEQPCARLQETDIDTRDAVVEYIKRHSPVKIEVAAGAVVVDRPRMQTP